MRSAHHYQKTRYLPPMRCRISLTLLISLASPLCAQDAAELWRTKVQPLLDTQCVKCHGPIEQKSGLELDTPEAILKGGDEGPAIVAGKPDESRLFTHTAAGADPHMPPKKQLTDSERGVIREWITALAAAPAPDKTAAAPESLKFPGITEAVDHHIAAGWQSRGLSPAPPADERTWCRRVYLDLAGRIPTEQEAREFLTSTAPDKRAALVDRLLAGDDHPVHLRELWDTLLMGRGKRENNEGRRRDAGWFAFLEDAFRRNRPWNEVVRDIIAARPDKPEAKGAAWFLYERKNEHQRIAEAVAPVIYGTRVDCAQCHDHPLAREIKQAHYWGLVAAFNRSKNVEGSHEVGESAVGGFINFTNLKKESQPAIVTMLTGRTIEETRPAGDAKEEDGGDKYVDAAAKVRVPKFSRRTALADAATQDNPLLARAFVNRMWATLMGRGIVHPVDEMNARNTPSHPALLDWLATDFAASGHNVRRFVRGIVLSQAYGLSAAPVSVPDAFAAAPERPLTAEQIARSWRIATGLPANDDTLRRAVIAALPDVQAAEYSASFQQAQFLTSSPALQDLLKPAPGSLLERAAAQPDPTAQVRALFAAIPGREPDAEEFTRTTGYLQSRASDTPAALRDIAWALLTSPEFLTVP